MTERGEREMESNSMDLWPGCKRRKYGGWARQREIEWRQRDRCGDVKGRISFHMWQHNWGKERLCSAFWEKERDLQEVLLFIIFAQKADQKNLSIRRRFCVLTRNLFLYRSMMMSMTPFLCSPTKIWLAQLVFIRWVNKISTLPKRSGQHFNRKLWFEHTFRVLRSPVCYFHIWGHPVMYFAFINFWYSSTFHCTEITRVTSYEANTHIHTHTARKSLHTIY